MGKRKLESNKDLLDDLMTYSPYGSLSEVFIMEAVHSYAKGVTEASALSLSSPVITNAWQGVAEDILKRMNEFYNRHDVADQED